MSVTRYIDLPENIREEADRLIGIELNALSPKTTNARRRIEAKLKGDAVDCWNKNPALFTSAFKVAVGKAGNEFLRLNEDVHKDNQDILIADKAVRSDEAHRKVLAKKGGTS